MSEDIVTRLRAVLNHDRAVELISREAADEIERLRRERDELQKWKDAHNTFWRDRADAETPCAKERISDDR